MARAKKKRGWTKYGSLLRAQLPLPGALLLVWALGLLEPWFYLGALIRELGFHLALACALVAAWALLRRLFLAAAALAGVATLFALPLYPLYRSTLPTPQYGPLLRVATADLNGVELTRETLSDWLTRERPDVLALTGLRRGWTQPNFDSYRAAVSDDHGAALLVQSALAVPQREGLRGHASLLVRAGRCQARVVTLELPAIADYAALDARGKEIAAARALPSAPRSVWLGQLGGRAQAYDLGAFIAAHQLRDARVGHGRLATAPGSWGALGFPLSDVLVHGWIGVRELNVRPPLAEGAQRALSAVLELTEPRCRFSRDTPTGDHFELKVP